MANDNNPQTIKPREAAAAPVPAPAAPAAPLTPKASDLPPNAEPAMEGQGETVAQEEHQEPEQPAAPAEPPAPEAGTTPLAEQIAPDADAPVKERKEGVDDVFEDFRDERQRIDEKAEESDIDLDTNQVIVGPKTVEELQAMILKMYPTKQVYDAAKKDPKSLLSMAIEAAKHGWGTTQGPDLTAVLKTNKAYEKLHDQRDTDRFQGIKDMRPNRVTHKNVDVAGQEAILALKSRMGGLVRVNLLNSGFWVAIRSPELDELQEIFATIDFENKQIGRILGGHFALITDMYLKRKFVELLMQKRLIVESNFKDVFKNGAFARNLAYHDYDTLIHAVVTLMTRGGLKYRCICPACGNVSVETLDISACKFVNEDLWTEEVRNYWATTRTPDGRPVRREENDLVEYRTKILKHESVYEQRFDNGLGEKVHIDLVLTEPTMSKYFEIGETLVHSLMETINHISNNEEDREDLVRSTLAIHSYQLIAPWVDSIKVYDADEKLELRTADPRAIIDHLDESVQKDEKLFNTLIEFIAKSRINYIGTCSVECPKCHAKPSSDMKTFMPLEIQTIFFGLLSRLWLSGR